MFHSHCDWRGRWPAAWRAVWLAALAGATVTAHAQTATLAARPDPLDPKAKVPAPAYDSSFARYRRLSDAKPIPWRDANDTVTGIGGWRAYLREAQRPEAAPGAKPVQAPAPADAARPLPAAPGRAAP